MGRQSAKFDKYENKSEVMEYKAAADVTLPRKREAEDDGEEEKPKLKKIKVCKLDKFDKDLNEKANGKSSEGKANEESCKLSRSLSLDKID